jgi:hypothetical protein
MAACLSATLLHCSNFFPCSHRIHLIIYLTKAWKAIPAWYTSANANNHIAIAVRLSKRLEQQRYWYPLSIEALKQEDLFTQAKKIVKDHFELICPYVNENSERFAQDRLPANL